MFEELFPVYGVYMTMLIAGYNPNIIPEIYNGTSFIQE